MPDEAPDVGVADMDEAAPAVSGPGSRVEWAMMSDVEVIRG
jgi:hypothetical protein